LGFLALAVVLSVSALRAPALAPGMGLLLPAALGLVFGASALLPAGGLAAVAALRERGRERAAAVVLGVTVAVDFRALAGAVLLAPSRAEASAPRLAWSAAAFASIVLSVWLLDPTAFLGAVGAPVESAPGIGLLNLLLYRGGPAAGTVVLLLKLASVAIAASSLLLVRRGWRGDAWTLAAFVSLAVLWLDPSPPAGAVVVPLLLLGLGGAALASTPR
jgi:hypothetical protein